MTKKLKLLLMGVAIFIATHTQLAAQQVTQIIKGEVIDKVTQVPLPGANIVVLTITLLNGPAFSLKQQP